MGGHANADPTGQNSFQFLSTFEESGRDKSERYIWRSSEGEVSVSVGGRFSIRTSGGSEVHIGFLGAGVQSEPRGEIPSEFKTIYYVGSPNDWRTASHFERVRYSAIYPGIDLVFSVATGQVEFTFEISPYANPRAIRMLIEGASVFRTPGGDLRMSIASLTITQRRPEAYQNVAGLVRRVTCHYHQRGREIELRLGSYDRRAPLFIDPVLNFSTYLGENSLDSIFAAATDVQGNLYATGETSSGNLTNASGAPRSSRDAFIAKFNNAGTQVSVVYLGGSSYDSGRGIALDPSGNIYLTGVTESTDFPVTPGALLTQAPGVQDAFVAKLNSSLALQYSTYLGGGSADGGLAIAVDPSGAAYIAGQTESTAFPVSASAFQRSNQGGISDCFVSKLNPAGSALSYSTYLGGSGLDLCTGLAVDASGNAYVAGTTYSANFPTVGALQNSLLGTANAFVSKVNAAGSALVYSTYLGGSILDNATAIAVDPSGEAYITGDTASIDFPTTPGVFQQGLNGQYNGFVSKLSAAGNVLVYSTLIGGSGSDVGTSIAIDSSQRAIIGGYTSSSNFPTFGAIQTAFGGVFDAFATVLDPNGATLIFSSYFGGASDDRGYAVAAAPVNKLYLAGITSSTNFPVAAAMQPGLSVAPDAFALNLAYLGGTPSAVSVTPSSGSGASQTFALQYADTAGAGSLAFVYAWFNTTLTGSGSSSCLLSYQPSTNQLSLFNDGATAWLAATLGAATTLQNSQCSVNVATATAVRSGNTLTLNLAMTFQLAYAGLKNIYMFASDSSGSNSGWQQEGAWTVSTGSGVPSAVSVTPSSGSGAGQTFALQYSDTAGAGSLAFLYAWFNATLTGNGSSSCLFSYQPSTNQLSLFNDGGTAWLAATLGAATTLQNSQCSVNVATATAVRSGNTLTLTLPMTFKAAYAGAKNIYMYDSDVSGANSGWQQLGTWTVFTSSGVPSTVSVTPSSGSGASQAFALQYSDTAGAGNLAFMYVWFSATLSGSGSSSCLLSYQPSTNQLSLFNDGATAWLAATLGAATTLQNSQCSVNMATATAVPSGNTLTLNLPMTFKAAYAGAKNIYMYGSDASGANSGWQQKGAWTVSTSSGLAAAVSVTPSSGSGATQAFALQYSDTAGAGNVAFVYVWFNTNVTGSGGGSCLLSYQPSTNQLSLFNDGATAWLAATLGAATTLQNSQCSVNVATTTAVPSGNTLTLNLAMTFQLAYAGAKNVYMFASDLSGSSSGWQQRGTWTVP